MKDYVFSSLNESINPLFDTLRNATYLSRVKLDSTLSRECLSAPTGISPETEDQRWLFVFFFFNTCTDMTQCK